MAKAPSKALAVFTGGRPTDYTKEIAQYICDRLAEGETLLDICEEEGMPKSSTVRQWCRRDEDDPGKTVYVGFAAMYARARLDHIEARAERIKQLASTSLLGETRIRKEVINAKTGEIEVLHEVRYVDNVQRSALMVAAEQWALSKIAWRAYGPKTAEPVLSAPTEDDNKIIIEGGLPDEEY